MQKSGRWPFSFSRSKRSKDTSSHDGHKQGSNFSRASTYSRSQAWSANHPSQSPPRSLTRDFSSSFISCFIPRTKTTREGANPKPHGVQTADVSSISGSKISTTSSDSHSTFKYSGIKRASTDGTRPEEAHLSIAEICRATGNFSQENVIGDGRFGTVYKGKLMDGSVVAVKRARKNLQNKGISSEFRSEIETLSNIEHQNLVRFLGCLENNEEQIIVTEYVGNGTLREHLDGTRGHDLELAQRLDIAIDVAHAITYLHTYTGYGLFLMALTEDNGATSIYLNEKVPAVAHPSVEQSSEVASNIVYHAQCRPHFSPLKFDPEQAFYATALSVRDTLIQRWNDTYFHFHKHDPKQTYYLSMEYLQGRALTNAIGNLDIQGTYADALNKLGHKIEEIVEEEKDAALGNGGLGRLASCFLDSMATLNLPAWGYGLRYRYGLFKQKISKEGQEELAEDWLEKFSPWEVVRHDVVFPIRFFGHVEVSSTGSRKWVGGEVLQALAYDVPIPGYKTKNTINLRLWDAKARAEDFNLFQFNDGQYESAALLHSKAQQICAVLYPGDTTENGKILRLKQQFFLCSASLQDIIARFKERKDGQAKYQWSEFPNKVAVQLNDTHPTLAIPELMRLLLDDEGLGWDEAWDVTSRTIAYTNHTVLPEALEKWSQAIMWKLLPRHMEIIEEIDKRFKAMVHSNHTDMESKLPMMQILDSSNPDKPVVRMANLCVVSSHTVNGVAQLHSDILKSELFANYVSLWPGKFQNKTNGITPRRWLRFCNQELSNIITKWLKSDAWITNLDLLSGLRQFADNEELHAEWASAKMASKSRLAQYLFNITGVVIDPNSLFDIQVKRIHEYKRQLLNILGAVYRYKKLKEMGDEGRKKATPRTIMIGGKAFATYTNAKRIVKLVNDVGSVVNNDPEIKDYLKVIFVPNYNVSVAEMLIPGSELSQHISTAGMEASGTSNMKFALNGCLIIGTLDGANVEIREEIGEDNFFLFGAKADEVPRLRKDRENGLFTADPRFEEAKHFIRSGAFGAYNYEPLLDSLEGNSGYGRGDYFLVGQDFPSYMDAQAQVDEAYKDKKRWLKMSILSTAGCGKFSSDRTISEYAKEIWGIKPCPVP